MGWQRGRGVLAETTWVNWLGKALKMECISISKTLTLSHNCILGQCSNCNGEREEKRMERGTKETRCMRRNSAKSPFSLPSGGPHYARVGSEFSAGQEGPCSHYYRSQQTAESISRSCESPAQPPLWSGNSRKKAEASTQSSHIGSRA